MKRKINVGGGRGSCCMSVVDLLFTLLVLLLHLDRNHAFCRSTIPRSSSSSPSSPSSSLSSPSSSSTSSSLWWTSSTNEQSNNSEQDGSTPKTSASASSSASAAASASSASASTTNNSNKKASDRLKSAFQAFDIRKHEEEAAEAEATKNLANVLSRFGTPSTSSFTPTSVPSTTTPSSSTSPSTTTTSISNRFEITIHETTTNLNSNNQDLQQFVLQNNSNNNDNNNHNDNNKPATTILTGTAMGTITTGSNRFDLVLETLRLHDTDTNRIGSSSLSSSPSSSTNTMDETDSNRSSGMAPSRLDPPLYYSPVLGGMNSNNKNNSNNNKSNDGQAIPLLKPLASIGASVDKVAQEESDNESGIDSIVDEDYYMEKKNTNNKNSEPTIPITSTTTTTGTDVDDDDEEEQEEDIQTTLTKLEASLKGSIRFAVPPSVQRSTNSNNNNSNNNNSNNNNKGSRGSGNLLPLLNRRGIYEIESPQQHAAFLQANPDKLVIMLFKASYCKACNAVTPRWHQVKNDPALVHLPIVFAEMVSTEQTRSFFRRMQILTLPTAHFYDGGKSSTASNNDASATAGAGAGAVGGGIVENFPCGPLNFSTLQQKLAQFLEARIDPITLTLRPLTTLDQQSSALPPPPRAIREVLINNELVTDEHLIFLRHQLPFFEDLTDEEFHTMLSKTKLLTFNEGDIIIRQGMPGEAFYVIKTGVCEMSIKSRFDDPIRTPPSYLGAVVNTLGKFDYFGERALTTREPYAASVRVLEKTRCFYFAEGIIPESSILSRKRRATREMVDKLTERYELPQDYRPMYTPHRNTERDQCILELLVRFKQIRQAAKCFDYIMSSEPFLGNEGEIARRSMLVSKLTKSQREDFVEVFNLVDTTKTGTISLLEMRRFMESAQEDRTDEELLQMLDKTRPFVVAADPNVDGRDGPTAVRFGRTGLQLNEFLGVMAEAEFYSLFTETFKELDKDNTGYVRAGDLDNVLRGVRDLISDDRKSIIDVVDQDVQVDYEQFAKMLLGAAL